MTARVLTAAEGASGGVKKLMRPLQFERRSIAVSNKSYWTVRPQFPKFPRLKHDLKVDVAVVGGGITGVTAAYLLQKAGRSVALLERDKFGGVDTSQTTAHLTFVTDIRLHELVSRFGRDHAQAAWDAGKAALDQIGEIVQAEDLACDFARVPGYLHAPWNGALKNEKKQLQQDVQLATDLGFDAEYLEVVPGVETMGVRFANQAKFHPLKYLARLLERIPGKKCQVFEGTEVSEVQEKPLKVKANGHSVICDYLVIATHVPLQGNAGLLSAALFQSKLAPYTSYAVGAQLPKGSFPEALFWDTSDPYHYLRIDAHPRYDYAIYGGEDHKTGQEERPEDRFRELDEFFAPHLPKTDISHRWSGQVIETNDGLPLIGETAERQFVATGYGGNGMTFGTLGAIMACDAALGRKNPWQALFDVSRKKLIGGTWDYLKENLDYPYYMIKDRLSAAEGKSVRNVRRGEGKILKLDGRRLAVYRDLKGKTTTLSPVCTHLGCIVHWNSAESTWDCPCHGSRFKPTGQVLTGPAESALEDLSTPDAG
jgi:glycine/D-amino acid oxidase-like deaminating enzyme/nitrite reductase/ring-hydroxylating ferredoxin subunit